MRFLPSALLLLTCLSSCTSYQSDTSVIGYLMTFGPEGISLVLGCVVVFLVLALIIYFVLYTFRRGTGRRKHSWASVAGSVIEILLDIIISIIFRGGGSGGSGSSRSSHNIFGGGSFSGGGSGGRV